MQKDVIYIDVDDDITSIIGKVKASKENVVALVPPKRTGVLQSAVNLRLLGRAAKQTDKHLAIVTNNSALIALSAAASIPVAKNLQTKPEIAEVPVFEVDDDEVIDGASLPVGEHAMQSKSPSDDKELRNSTMAASLAAVNKEDKPGKIKKKSEPKIPNFDVFRKKLVFIILGILLLIGFLVWAIFFAPRATVVISAKTTSSSVNEQVTVSSSAKTSLANQTLKAVSENQSEEKSVTFPATGKKDAGKKATGTVEFSTNSISNLGTTIPAGTKLTSSSGVVFVTDTSVTMTFENYRGAEAGITATENGSKYNAASGSVSGAPDGISAEITDATSGGVTKTVKVITASDVQTAKQNLVDEDTNSIRDDLKSKFNDSVTVIDESFSIEYKDVTSNPAVGDEADDATLTATIAYSLYGVDKDDLTVYLDQYFKNELDGIGDQRVYENGSKDVVFQEASKANNGAKATLIATAQIGPKIEDKKVKEDSKGKRFGEIQQSLESVQGIDSVDVRFFPFWVSVVPDDESKITVEFKLDESK